MPVHDWAGIEARTFYPFHFCWIATLAGRLNQGLLPDGYGALPAAIGVANRPPTRRTLRSIDITRFPGRTRVAVIEIVSPYHKRRPSSVGRLAEKVTSFIDDGVHVSLIDVTPRTIYNPTGIHGAVWSVYERTPFIVPPEPLLLASYIGRPGNPEALIDSCAVRQPLPSMPLFLTSERYVMMPLESTYLEAFGCLGASYRAEIEANGA